MTLAGTQLTLRSRGGVSVTGMCGRYTLANPDWFDYDFSSSFPTLGSALRRPRFNVAPGQQVIAFTRSGEGRRLEAMHWGIETNWKKGPKQLINARAEKLTESRYWKSKVAEGRCAIPADGFYEWRPAGDGGSKQPFHFAREGRAGFAFAGLAVPAGDGESTERQCVIITVEPNELVESVHDRMPAMLKPEQIDRWLGDDVEAALDCLGPFPSIDMTAVPVSTAVGNPARDAPELIEPVEVDPPPEPHAQDGLF